MRQGTDYFRQEDVDIHIIITNSTAVVTGVVDDVPTISGATFVITDEDLAQEAFEIHGGICSQERPIIGLCESTQLSFSVLRTTESEIILPQVDEKVAAYMWFNEDSSNLMQIGYYNIESIDNSLKDTEIKYSCFDDMYKFRNTDVAEWYYGFFETNSTPTISEFTEGLCDELGISLSGALVNGTLEIKQFIFDKDIISAGYLFSLIAEANGGFGNINYDGSFHIVYVSAGQINATTITEDDRFDSNRGAYEYKFKPTGVKLLDSNGVRIAKYRDVKENPYIITNNLLLISIDEENRKTALKKIYYKINAWGFAACDVTTIGDLMVELGDRIRVNEEAEEDTDDDGFFKTFVFERIYTGVYLPKDEYKAKGSKEMTQTESIAISDSFTGGSVAPNTNQEVSKNYQIIGTSMSYDDLPEIIRNFGLRLLDEPTNVSISENDGIVGLQWTDPIDLTDDKPCPVIWAGTKIVRANGKAPLNPFKSEYTVIADVTTRNQYEDEPLYDIVSTDNNYVYGIFPYDTEGHYRYTKSIGINTGYKGEYPEITSITQTGSNVVVNYTLPSGTWTSRKLVYKRNAIPQSDDDGTAVDLASTETEIDISGIIDDGSYYFVIFMQNSNYIITSNVAEMFSDMRFTWIDFLDIVKSANTAHRQTSPENAYTGADLSDKTLSHKTHLYSGLSSYMQTNYNLLVGNRDKSLGCPTVDSYGTIIMPYINGDYSDIGLTMPIHRMTNVKKITFTARNTRRTSSPWWQAYIELASYDTDNNLPNYEVGINLKFDSLPENEWHDYEVICDVPIADYIHLGRANGSWEIKNLKFQCERYEA